MDEQNHAMPEFSRISVWKNLQLRSAISGSKAVYLWQPIMCAVACVQLYPCLRVQWPVRSRMTSTGLMFSPSLMAWVILLHPCWYKRGHGKLIVPFEEPMKELDNLNNSKAKFQHFLWIYILILCLQSKIREMLCFSPSLCPAFT